METEDLHEIDNIIERRIFIENAKKESEKQSFWNGLGVGVIAGIIIGLIIIYLPK